MSFNQKATFHAFVLVMLTNACARDELGTPVLGLQTHDLSQVQIDVIATQEQGLMEPTDVAFQPGENRLWISNRRASGISVIENPGTPTSSDRVFRNAPGSLHFMPRPSSLAFGDNGFFATSHDTDDRTQSFTDGDFMGPTLWTSNLDLFNGGHASHFDMMHNSPNAQGIAWEVGNAYWVADGFHHSLTRYDFQADHMAGGEDHSDGTIERHLEGVLGYEQNVPSHLEYDHEAQLLFVCDPANSRILVVKPHTGTRAVELEDNYDFSADAHAMTGTEYRVLASGGDLHKPSGLALFGRLIFVSDAETARILAFDRAGVLVDYLDLRARVGDAALGGLAFDGAGALYVAVTGADQVLRLRPRAR